MVDESATYTEASLRAPSNPSALHASEGTTSASRGMGSPQDENLSAELESQSHFRSRLSPSWMDRLDSTIYFFHPSIELPGLEERLRDLPRTENFCLNFVVSLLGTTLTWNAYSHTSSALQEMSTMTRGDAEAWERMTTHLATAGIFWYFRASCAGWRDILHRRRNGITERDEIRRANHMLARVEVLSAIGTGLAGPYLRGLLTASTR